MTLTNGEGELGQDFVTSLNSEYSGGQAEEILELAFNLAPGAIAFANSFGLEDLVVQHLLLKEGRQTETFVLDTGRLPPETYELIEQWRQRFHLQLRILSPKAELLERYVHRHGPNAFYQSIDLRKDCCAIRKMEPLQRALLGKKAWITGLRRQQSNTRSTLDIFELDQLGRLKVSPLAFWSFDEVWAYVREHDLPYNSLHDRGYPSIGCAPCTRAVGEGEDIRAGRWWWEIDQPRECGLHSNPKKTELVNSQLNKDGAHV